jgi:hypothetical protein
MPRELDLERHVVLHESHQGFATVGYSRRFRLQWRKSSARDRPNIYMKNETDSTLA